MKSQRRQAVKHATIGIYVLLVWSAEPGTERFGPNSTSEYIWWGVIRLPISKSTR